RSKEVKNPRFAMPGPFPGRVVEVRYPGAVDEQHKPRVRAVQDMMVEGMCRLTGTAPARRARTAAERARDAWRYFFKPGDGVGIKVNPAGRKPKPKEAGRVPGAVGSISNREVLFEVVEGLQAAGVKPQDIIVFERYANEFRDAGYEEAMSQPVMDGVRWF